MRKMPTTRAGNADLCLRKVHDELLSDSVVLAIPLGEGPQAVLELRRGLVAEVTLERTGVGVGDGHIARLHRNELLMGLKVVVDREHALLHQHAL